MARVSPILLDATETSEGETALLVVVPAEQAAAVAAFIAQLNAEAEDHASEPN